MSIPQQVAKLRHEGATHMEIAEALNISTTAVARAVKKARADGIMPPAKEGRVRGKIDEELKTHGLLRGNVQDVLEGLTPEMRDWFMRQTPRGTTVASMLAAIVIDAYNDEVWG